MNKAFPFLIILLIVLFFSCQSPEDSIPGSQDNGSIEGTVEAKTFSLVVTTNLADNSSLIISPEGTTFPEGSIVTITAKKVTGYSFNSWNGNAGNNIYSATITVTMNRDRTIQAIYKALDTFTVTTGSSIVGQNPVTISAPEGFYSGSQITLTADNYPGYLFLNWIDGGKEITDNPYTFTLQQNSTINAVYRELQTVIVTAEVDDPATGIVELSPYNNSDEYFEGTQFTLNAIPKWGYTFDYWDGDVDNIDINDPTLTFEAWSEIGLVACFAIASEDITALDALLAILNEIRTNSASLPLPNTIAGISGESVYDHSAVVITGILTHTFTWDFTNYLDTNGNTTDTSSSGTTITQVYSSSTGVGTLKGSLDFNYEGSLYTIEMDLEINNTTLSLPNIIGGTCTINGSTY